MIGSRTTHEGNILKATYSCFIVWPVQISGFIHLYTFSILLLLHGVQIYV